MVVVDGVDLDALDYVVKVPYNGTGATGGDSLTQDLNIWYEVGFFPLRRLVSRKALMCDHADWRHRVDDHGNSTCVAHDSGRRVSAGIFDKRIDRGY